MEKSEIRKKVLAQLKKLSPTEHSKWSRWSCQMICSLSAYQEADTIATFLSMSHEVDTRELIRQAQKDGKRVLIPKTAKNGHMDFVPYDESCLERSSFGVLEPQAGEIVPPSEIALIHVPGLAWNQKGYRIGYGGGYYDRYLVSYQGMTVSTICDKQRYDFTPEPYDQAVKEVFCYETTREFTLSNDQ